MIARKLLLVLFTVLWAATARPQMCEQMKLLTEGASYTITSYDAKDKMTSVSKNRIISSVKKGEAVEAVINNEIFDHKGKSTGSSDVAVRCENNVLIIDLRSMINPQSMQGFENMEVKVENNSMEIPSDLIAGTNLKDGVLKMNIANEGMDIATIEIKIHNRKVEGKEKVTTAVGTFDAWKIKYDMEMVTTAIIPLRIVTKGIDWFAPEIGTIRTESYNRQGKLSGYSELTEASFAIGSK